MNKTNHSTESISRWDKQKSFEMCIAAVLRTVCYEEIQGKRSPINTAGVAASSFNNPILVFVMSLSTVLLGVRLGVWLGVRLGEKNDGVKRIGGVEYGWKVCWY
jgi:hypothetical protein